LGHDVVRADPDYPPSVVLAHMIPRYLRGIHDDAEMMPRPDRLEARSRAMARLGGLFSDRRIAAVRAGEDGVRDRVLSVFDDVDVVITPGAALGPPRIGAFQRRGAISTLMVVGTRVPFQEVFNVTGQPAAVVPWAFDRDGLPLSIQLVGRPHDEATLLSLSAQIETARPWAHHHPPV
jgi:amidase